tara:strand:+ start:7778 stop:8086 length:309 start_codon:yes stop_codon:yes gene_type:complete
MTLGYSTLKKDDVLYLYHSPPEISPVGVIIDIQKNIICLKTIKRESGDTKNGTVIEIELRKNPPITILDKEDQKQFLTTSELKRLKEVQKQTKEESEQILWE